ncbi:MAG: DNA primase [Candidatus Rokuibacteriota bacterium]|nr:MAG: DNA primase [Candidatus Rokubacteria bacterium]PYN55774.1 MAG: DNA primase [Candidatus Rokubacteria bacterium]
MAQYAQALLDDVRNAVDIVDLVGRFVNLRKAGVNWKGLCPFHGEKTPSFMVNPKKGIFHCFGCGVGGDVFGFLMRQDRLSFPEAVRSLAKTAGIALPEEGVRSGDSGREELIRIVDLAWRFYDDTLWRTAGDRARAYLEQRGIDADVAKRFGLGYAPEGWDGLLTFMRSQKVTDDALVTAGLAVQRENRSGVYDRFRGRLLFPIRDLQGRVVAFGGRGFGDEQPKYLNSPETPLYTKGNLLYAADIARPTIQTKNRALLVEGYVDCLMAHQHGFTETVAALGTSFTAAQLALLRRYCDEVVTFFDADAAGQKAAERAEELLEPTSGGMAWAVNRSGSFEGGGTFRVKVALLPAGHDPDTFLRESGAPAFAERIGAARSLLAYALDRAVVDPDGATGARARTTAFARVAVMLAKVADAQEAAALSREAAAKLGVDATQLWIEAQRLQSSLRTPPARPQTAPAPSSTPPVERDLVTLLLRSVEARAGLLAILDETDDLGHPPLRSIVAALKRRPDAPAESLMTDLETDEARSVLSSLLVEDRESLDVQVSIEQFQRRLERSQRLRRAREVSQTIAETQAKTGVAAPMHTELRTLHEESAVVYGITGGVAQSLEHGTPGSPRSSDE